MEDILKNQKLGKWGLGLSKAIYKYDKDQYEKEKTAQDSEYEKSQDQRNIDESNADMMRLGEDDDFGGSRCELAS